jgi:16S rRNA (cytosine967-C5)-methyltransferase
MFNLFFSLDKYKINSVRLQEVLSKQEHILQVYPSMLKRGGILVYATCSIFPSENEKQIKRFLDKNANFTLLEERTIYPSASGFDGFFVAKLQKK